MRASLVVWPSIAYAGSGHRCNGVETFTLADPVPVKQGDQLAIREKGPSLLYCSGSILQFIPPLKPGADFRKATEDEGSCQLLIEAEYLEP